jgi:hypothetical protein
MRETVFINDKEIVKICTYRYQGRWLAKWGGGDQMDE